MNQSLPQELGRESLNQLSKEQLVEIIIEQSKAIGEFQEIIIKLQQEIERLKVSRDLDSSNSSKPPSGDIHKKSENKKAALQQEANHPKENWAGNQDILEQIKTLLLVAGLHQVDANRL